jgi:uncharacterized protein YjbI with pentapeptide repeats
MASRNVFLALPLAFLTTTAEEILMKAENAVVITFGSQENRTYKVLGAESADGPWRSLQDGIAGTGGEVTVFYKSASDQKLFFKVEGADGSSGQQPILSPTRQSLLAAARLNLSAQSFAAAQLPGADLMRFTLDDANFEAANLKGANLTGAAAQGTSFNGADLRSAVTDGQGRFEGASFNGADLRGFVTGNGNFNRANFNGANLEGTRVWASMINADFRNAPLNGAAFLLSRLSGANFSGQNLSNVIFRSCTLNGADLTGAKLAGAELTRCQMASPSWEPHARLDGAVLTNVNMEGTLTSATGFSGADLRESLLRGMVVLTDWREVNAAGVDASFLFAGVAYSQAPAYLPVNMSGANFAGANLEGIALIRLTPYGPREGGINLTGANLRSAKLHGADLRKADLSNVDFSGADLSFAELEGATLTGATGFDAEQPGMDFGTGTVLPDGTRRTGINPGTGLAPATAPGKLRFEINDLGTVQSRELTFTGTQYIEPGRAGGTFNFRAKGRIGTLGLPLSPPSQYGDMDYYTLLFTSPMDGKLFKNRPDGNGGVFLIGTFTVPQ